MIEDHDIFFDFDDNYLSIINFRLIKRKLIRVWFKKKFHHMREKYFEH